MRGGGGGEMFFFSFSLSGEGVGFLCGQNCKYFKDCASFSVYSFINSWAEVMCLESAFHGG